MQVAYTADVQKLSQSAAEIPWGHNVVLLEMIKKPGEREWKAIDHGWSSGKKALLFSTTNCIIVA